MAERDENATGEERAAADAELAMNKYANVLFKGGQHGVHPPFQ
jgi:hypothetical protein